MNTGNDRSSRSDKGNQQQLMKRNPCKNHPDRISARKCYHCHAHICTECQLNLDHHLFCSRSCYFRWKWHEFTNKIHVNKELAAVAAILLIFNIFTLIYFNSRLASIQQTLIRNNTAKNDTIIIKNHAQQVKFDTTRYPLENVFQLKLSAKEGTVAALERDGKFIESHVQNYKPLVFPNQFLEQGVNEFSVYLLENGGKSRLVDSFTITYNSARVDYMRRYITRIEGDSSGIALTFDGGSTDNGTRKILNILREMNVRCTIFLTGMFLKKYPDLVRQMVDDGHEIGNHSLTHPHLTMLEKDGSTKTLKNVNRRFIFNQLSKTDSLFRIISGKPMSPLWRAPYGELNNDILLWAAEAGYKHVGWSRKCDTWDWVTDTTSAIYRTAPEILEHFLELDDDIGLGGKIILMHLGTERKEEIPNGILKALIAQLRKRGYRFKTVGQLLTNS